MTLENLIRARDEYSNAQKNHRTIRIWYQRLSNPTPQEQLIFMASKQNVSNTAKKYFALREEAQGEASKIPANSAIETVTESLNEILRTEAENRERKHISEAAMDGRKRYLIMHLERNPAQREMLIRNIDKTVVTLGYCEPWGEKLTPEQWEKFKKAHPLLKIVSQVDSILSDSSGEALESEPDTNTESELTVEAEADDIGPAMPPPFKAETRPVLDIDPDSLKGE